MNNIICALNEIISFGFDKMTLSNVMRKSQDIKKITIERQGGKYAATLFYEKKAEHLNFSDITEVSEFLGGEAALNYKQADIIKDGENTRIISNKRGNFKVTNQTLNSVSLPKLSVTHDREKEHILREGEPVGFLISLGITNAEGFIKKEYRKKFTQINSFLEIVKTTVKHIENGAHVVDFGCGKSYLTFALYYYLNIDLKKNVTITGIDLKEDVISFCTKTAAELGYDNLNFICTDIFKSTIVDKADMVVALHACDTASDLALFKAIEYNSRVILCAPCCQHELSGQIRNNDLNLILKHGILKERLAAIVTDAFRAGILKDMGYSVSLVEFTDTEHTPKNIMIKAVRSRQKNAVSNETRMIADFFGVSPVLLNWVDTGRTEND